MAQRIEPISQPMPGVAISYLLENLLLESGCHALEKAQKAQWRGPGGKKLRTLITAQSNSQATSNQHQPASRMSVSHLRDRS